MDLRRPQVDAQAMRAWEAICLAGFLTGVGFVMSEAQDFSPSEHSTGTLDIFLTTELNADRVSTVACKQGLPRIRTVRATSVISVPDDRVAAIRDTWELAIACVRTQERRPGRWDRARATYKLDPDQEAILRCHRSRPLAVVDQDGVVTVVCADA